MTNQDRAAALRALEQRALATGQTGLAFNLRCRADIFDAMTDPPLSQRQLDARLEWLTDGRATYRKVVEEAREAAREALARAELAEAALAVLEGA